MNLVEAERIFHSAAQLAANSSDRIAILRRECGDDSVLREKVERLLAAHDDATDFMAIRPLREEALAAHLESPGSMVGRYNLMEKIGEGGFGVVYMAEQREPVKRPVALKIIKLGLDSNQVVARFEAERQALAMMDHPNIAKVLDGGATEMGRPYFVMELVRGLPFIEYCDEAKLTTDQRVSLFLAVCQAVQHAHQKGIIHRDIKPQNILVTLHDGVPVPKVIDFGVAKATHQELTEKTFFTQFHQMIGTPAYMSPEQAEMSGLDVDTRTDIYSLGVVLYEVLTGKTPLDGKHLMSCGYDEIRRRISEEEAVKPSTRAGALKGDERTAVASRRKVEPSQLGCELKGDLDWIVLKALEKDRTQRYDTAQALASDLRRYLSDEPVEAAAPSTIYLCRKLLRKYRKPITAAAAMAVMLIGGTIVSIWQAYRATSAEAQERQAKIETQSALERAILVEQEARRDAARAVAGEQTARRNAYASDMLLARQALNASNFRRARKLLERHRPGIEDETIDDFRGWEWFWLRNQLRSGNGELLATLEGVVFGLSVSSDGCYLAASTFDGALKVFEASSGREITAIEAGGGMPTKPVFLKGQSRFIYNHTTRESYRTEGSLKIWNADTRDIDFIFNYNTGIASKAVSPDNSKVLFRVPYDGLRMLDLKAKTVLWKTPLVGQGGRTDGDSFFFSLPDGEAYLVGEKSGEVSVYATATGERTARFKAHSGAITALKMSSNGRLLASAARDPETVIKLWDPKSLNQVGKLEGHRGWVSDLEFSTDGRRLVSSSADQTVRMWDVDSGKELAVYHGIEQEVWELELAPNEQFIIAGGERGAMYSWETAALDIPESPIIAREVRHCAKSVGGNRLALLFQDGTIKLGDFGSSIRWKDTGFAGRNNTSMHLSPGGRQLVAGKGDGSVSIYDVASGQEMHSSSLCDSPILAVALLSSSGAILAGDSKHHLLLARPEGKQMLWETVFPELEGSRNLVMAVSPDERMAAVRNFFGDVMLVDLATGDATRSARNPSSQANGLGLAFSPDGKTLATTDLSGVVGLWDVATLERRDALEGHRHSSGAVVFLPGDRIASGGSYEDGIIIWDRESKQELLRIPVEDRIIHLEFVPQLHLLLGLTEGGDLYSWRAPPT